MKKIPLIAATLITTTLIAGAAMADGHTPMGDMIAGEATFGKRCVACHVVVDADGNKLAGRSGRSGPNLYAIAGRQIGSLQGFRYSKDLAALGQGDGDPRMWDEDRLTGFIQNPTGWLREASGNDRARSKMSFKLRGQEDALNLYAYLYSLAPPEAAQ